MDNTGSKAIKSGIWYMVGNFLVKGTAYLTTPIFTRLMTKADFGAFNNYLSWQSIFLILVTLNLESTLISAKFDHKDDLDSYILSMFCLSGISAVIWLAASVLFPSFFSETLHMETGYIMLMFVYLMFLPAVQLFQTREQFFYRYKTSMAVSTVLTLVTAGVSILLVVLLSDKVAGRIVGSVAVTILTGAILAIYFLCKGKKVRFGYWKYALPIALPYIPHLLSMTLLNSTDRVMITQMCGEEQTAVYSLAYTVGAVVTLLTLSFNGAYAPWLGEKLNSGDLKSVRKFSYTYIAIFAFLAVGIMLVSPEILYIAGGKAYSESKYVMAPVAMGCVCQFLYTMFVNIEQYQKKTMGMAIGSIAAAASNFLLNLLLIPKIGYLAAAYTTLAGYLILLMIHMVLVRRLGFGGAYDYKFVIATVLFGICIMILITLLYDHQIIRGCVILVYGVCFLGLVFRNRTKIRSLLSAKNQA